MTSFPWAPGFIDGDRPKIVTSRFRYEDSHTLERYLATGGYEGLARRWLEARTTCMKKFARQLFSGAVEPGSQQAEMGAHPDGVFLDTSW